MFLYSAAFITAFFLALWLYKRSPSSALVAVLVTQPFSFDFYVVATTITLSKVVLVAVAIGALSDLIRGRIPLPGPYSRWILIAGVALVFATAVSIFQAANLGDAVRETFKAIEYALLVSVAWLLAARYGTTKLFKSLPFFAIVVCATALLDLVLGPKSVVVVGGVIIPRVAGFLEGPNQLGGWLALIFPFLLVFAVTAQEKAQRFVNSFALFVVVFTAILTYSRASLLSMGLELVCVLGFVYSRRNVGACVVLFVAGVAGLALSAHYTPGTLAYLTSVSQQTDAGGVGTRAVLWAAAVELWHQHPLLGLGAGNFEDSLAQAGLHGVKTHANNVYLQAGVEGGIPLFAATLALLFLPLFSVVAFLRRNAAIAATFAALLGFAIHGFVDDLWFFPKVATMWCVVVGVAATALDVLKTRELHQTLDRARLTAVGTLVRESTSEFEPAMTSLHERAG